MNFLVASSWAGDLQMPNYCYNAVIMDCSVLLYCHAKARKNSVPLQDKVPHDIDTASTWSLAKQGKGFLSCHDFIYKRMNESIRFI